MATHSNPARSPSPGVPAVPIALTPGALATRLTDLYRNALTHTLKSCSYENFALCFPTPAARRPDVLKNLWEQVVSKIESKATEEFQGILEERDVIRGLNGLEGLVGEAKKRKAQAGEGEKPVASDSSESLCDAFLMFNRMHTLSPQDLYLAHLSPQLVPIQSELESQLSATQSRNEELVNDIRRQRDEIETLLNGVETIVKDLEGANAVLEDTISSGGVRSEILDINMDLKEVSAKL